jgi:hypothetical protein
LRRAARPIVGGDDDEPGARCRIPGPARRWYFGQSVVTMAIFAAIAVCGFALSAGGQMKFRDPVLE